MRSKLAMLRNSLATRKHIFGRALATAHLRHRARHTSTPSPARTAHRQYREYGDYRARSWHSGREEWRVRTSRERGMMRLALFLISLLAVPLVGWCVERLFEHLPRLERLGADVHRAQPDPLRELVGRRKHAETMVSAPPTFVDAVSRRIGALAPPPPVVVSAGVAATGWDDPWGASAWMLPAAWPPTSDGSLVRPASVVLGVLWFWALLALWAGCLVGLAAPALSLRVIEVFFGLASRLYAVVQALGALFATVSANIPITAGLSLLVLGVGVAAWMVLARQFNRYVVGV